MTREKLDDLAVHMGLTDFNELAAYYRDGGWLEDELCAQDLALDLTVITQFLDREVPDVEQ